MEPVPVDGGDPVPGAPRRASYALDGDGAWIAEARRLAKVFLTRVQTEDGLPVSSQVVEVTQLVVSELVTNARKYAPGPVRLDLRIAGDALEVMVRDGSTVLPVAGVADPDRVGRHGLEIVLAVARGVEVRPEPTGKRITALIPLMETGGR
ncbi:ATP-binding protein [Streptomyces sp. NEAU-W12]|uniref:ATP-binding protein n=1 Tax=Streptomyces sp. NEAU-W12 TaxID=2994668 RepID=UPI00224A52A5|nr:ATP-binding protein [Streptomyces sp. NEAU-W12]MCX2925023.1 ATP-binding protein [Streptomyces sp. NEAU-W12]